MNRLLPCLADVGYSTDFSPVVGVDIFLANSFKTNGSIQTYATAHPPAHLGYNVATQTCHFDQILRSEALPSIEDHEYRVFISELMFANQTIIAALDRYAQLERTLIGFIPSNQPS
jgi:hypothetical protein